MADWAAILAESLGGLSKGLGQVRQSQLDRSELERRQKLLAIQEQQNQRQQSKQELDAFMTRLQALPLDADIDPSVAQEAAKFGLASSFAKDPTTGGLRRRATPDEQYRQALMKKTGVETQAAEIDVQAGQKAQAALKFIQEQPEQFMQQPEHIRQIMWQTAGRKGDFPMTPEELAKFDMAGSAGERSVANIYSASRVTPSLSAQTGENRLYLDQLTKMIAQRETELMAELGLTKDLLIGANAQRFVQRRQQDPQLQTLVQQRDAMVAGLGPDAVGNQDATIVSPGSQAQPSRGRIIGIKPSQ